MPDSLINTLVSRYPIHLFPQSRIAAEWLPLVQSAASDLELSVEPNLALPAGYYIGFVLRSARYAKLRLEINPSLLLLSRSSPDLLVDLLRTKLIIHLLRPDGPLVIA